MIPRGLPYDEAMRQFRWPRPERFNMGRAVCERHPREALALIVEAADGAVRNWTFGQLLAASSRLANALAAQRHRQGRPRRRVPEPGRGAHDLPHRRLSHGRRRAAAVHAVRRGSAGIPPGQRRGLGRHHRHEPAAQGAGGARSPAASQDHRGDRRRRQRQRLPRLGPPAGRRLRQLRHGRHAGRGSRAPDLHLGHDRPAQGRAARPSRAAGLDPAGRAVAQPLAAAATR